MLAGSVIGLRWNTVTQVIDGDTFRMGNGQKVRLVGIDAPEMGLCGSKEAQKELAKIVMGKKVELTQVKADNYGRVLALAKVGEQVANIKMIESGWARWDGTENGEGGKFVVASEGAREKGKGVWGECHKSGRAGCEIKGNVEKRSGETKGGRKLYFYPGCSEYGAVVVERELGEEWFCSEQEAKAAGYVRAGNCF